MSSLNVVLLVILFSVISYSVGVWHGFLISGIVDKSNKENSHD
jgi:hypothetical protein